MATQRAGLRSMGCVPRPVCIAPSLPPPHAGSCPKTTSPQYLPGFLMARRASNSCKPTPSHHYNGRGVGVGRFFAGTQQLYTVVGRAPWMATERAGPAQGLDHVPRPVCIALSPRHPPAGTWRATISPQYLPGSLITRRSSNTCKPVPSYHYKGRGVGVGGSLPGRSSCMPWSVERRRWQRSRLVPLKGSCPKAGLHCSLATLIPPQVPVQQPS